MARQLRNFDRAAGRRTCPCRCLEPNDDACDGPVLDDVVDEAILFVVEPEHPPAEIRGEGIFARRTENALGAKRMSGAAAFNYVTGVDINETHEKGAAGPNGMWCLPRQRAGRPISKCMSICVLVSRT